MSNTKSHGKIHQGAYNELYFTPDKAVGNAKKRTTKPFFLKQTIKLKVHRGMYGARDLHAGLYLARCAVDHLAA
jgi:hypothetical protein